MRVIKRCRLAGLVLQLPCSFSRVLAQKRGQHGHPTARACRLRASRPFGRNLTQRGSKFALTGKLIAFEGLDGSGKSTQIKLLTKALRRMGIAHECISFPRTHVKGYGEAIAMFLRGEFGSVKEVNPYFVAALFAGDRASARPQMEEWLNAGKFVVADRYFHSNLAFQGAKITVRTQKEHFRKWIREVEFENHRIPKPSLTIFFDVPMSFVKDNISKRHAKETRTYLKGKLDIHEAAFDLQEDVAREYRSFSKSDPSFVQISRIRDHGMREALEVHHEVLMTLRLHGLMKGAKIR